jgi:serine/threonine protein kinase
MGEVYRAKDTRLGRIVAIKILPPALSGDPEARGRFEREARAISHLNHPHICALYDVGRARPEGASAAAGEIEFLVMEFLDGESLAARLARRPMTLSETLDLSIQIADALDKAHRQGIVHRDLKPGNVMLVKRGPAQATGTTPRGADAVAKLLDFGLAKLAPVSSIGTPDTAMTGAIQIASQVTGPVTAAGTVLGTFQYMAPEQLEARDVDARADIWAFGCVLYEMLTGRRAFDGTTTASQIAAILGGDPTPPSELQPLTPPALDRVIRICLAKDPDARFQSSYDLLLQLQSISENGSTGVVSGRVIEHDTRRQRLMWIAAGVGALALGAAGAWYLKPAPIIANVSERFSLELPPGEVFTREGRRDVAISPDGRRMAYIASHRIYLREMDQLVSKPVAGTDTDPLELTFSPDGQSLAYFVQLPSGVGLAGTEFRLMKIPIAGGTPVALSPPTGSPHGVRWQGHTIAFGQNTDRVRGIFTVPDTPDASGMLTTLIAAGKDERVGQPYLLDGGKVVLFTVETGSGNAVEGSLVLQAPGETTRTVLVKGGIDGVPVADRLVYWQSDTLFGIGFDARARAVRGEPVPILKGVRASTVASGDAQYGVADNGTLVFVPGSAGGLERELVWVDRHGKEEIIPMPIRAYRHPRISPDGTRIVVAIETPPRDESQNVNLFIWDVARHGLTQLTSDSDRANDFPLWMPGGRSVVYRSLSTDGTARIMQLDASGATAPEKVLDLGKIDRRFGTLESVAPDGHAVTIRMMGRGIDVYTLPLTGSDRVPRPLLDSPAIEMSSAISPNGKIVAYVYGDGGSGGHIFARPYPDIARDRWPVSTEAGDDIVWARSSGELFFISGGKMLGVIVQPGPVFGRETELFDNTPYLDAYLSGVDYDVASDGRFLMIRQTGVGSESGVKPSLVIVTHWTDELRARVK